MKVIVCVKQVPEIADVQIDPETGTLIREGVDSILNPFCEYAVEMALGIKRQHPETETVAMSMGPFQAKAALMRCLETGIDRAVLLVDKRFAGADTWATALTLAEAIRTIEGRFDLILVGKQAIDGDTAQVGPEISEILGIPEIMYGVGLELRNNKKKIRVTREIETGNEIVETKLPCLISLSKGPMIRSISSFQEILDARNKELRLVTADDLAIDDDKIGLKGSFTQVVKIFPPRVKKQGEIFDGSDAHAAAHKLTDFLSSRRFI
jgi:electron transfer flavoprotein alpha/beta subunit